MDGKIVNGKGVSLLARLRLREVSESEKDFNRLERAMRYGKRLKLAKRVPRDIFLPEDKQLWFLFERIYTVFHDKEVAVLRRFGLTPMQYNVLEFVYVSSCKPTLGFIVDELRVSYGNLFAVVKNLTKKGLFKVETISPTFFLSDASLLAHPVAKLRDNTHTISKLNIFFRSHRKIYLLSHLYH